MVIVLDVQRVVAQAKNEAGAAGVMVATQSSSRARPTAAGLGFDFALLGLTKKKKSRRGLEARLGCGMTPAPR